MKKEKKTYPILFLLFIPGSWIIDAILLYLGPLLDIQLFSNSEAVGHPLPVFTVLAILAAIVFSITMLILAIVLTVVGFKRKKRRLLNQSQTIGE